jgi:GH15 family glucan-1,4-alpha-glucosidase
MLGSSNNPYRDGNGYLKISDYGVIGDTRSCALIGVDGSVDWCCFPRFDSPSVFAAILDSDKGGSFQLFPRVSYTSTHQYKKHTVILTTIFNCGEGRVKLTDFMPCYMNHGQVLAPHEIVRRVEGLDGDVPMNLLFQPRLNYAKAPTKLSVHRNTAFARTGDLALTFFSTVSLLKDENSAAAEFTSVKGNEEWFVVRHGDATDFMVDLSNLKSKLDMTAEFWRIWALRCTYRGRWREQVIRSALTLKMLQYLPSGALVAAATTSLPESIGGVRNWDYRYTWLRDAAFSIYALNKVGHKAESNLFLSWFIGVSGQSGANLQIMYGVEGERYLDEKTLDHLAGYKGSKPVRIGNAAYEQFQLDVYGMVVDAAYFSHAYVSKDLKDLYGDIQNVVNFVVKFWQNPDSGLWEIRGARRHYVHSKMWAWVALDRGVKLARELGYPDDVARWVPVRKMIKSEIMEKGWSERRNAFTMYYGSDALDASVLMMPIVGFLPANHPRMESTIDQIIKELSHNGFVRRYKIYDNLDGKEGSFLICSFWLVDCLTQLGRLDDAEKLLNRLIRCANRLGLYSEEIDSRTGAALGNFPTAYPHMALIGSAINLNAALHRGR